MTSYKIHILTGGGIGGSAKSQSGSEHGIYIPLCLHSPLVLIQY